jgi:hypothetical protein
MKADIVRLIEISSRLSRAMPRNALWSRSCGCSSTGCL